jgi:hypothetical protein
VTPRQFERGHRVAAEQPDVNDMTHGDTPTPTSQTSWARRSFPGAPTSLLGEPTRAASIDAH